MSKKLSKILLMSLFLRCSTTLSAVSLPENLKPNYECLNDPALRQVAVCFKEQDLKKNQSCEAKEPDFNWQGYGIALLGGIAIGVFLSLDHR